MAKNKKHYSYGPVWQERTGRLVEMLVCCANDELDDLPRGLNCTWKEEDPSCFQLVVRTQLKVLERLSTQLHENEPLKIDQIRQILKHYLPEHLKILDDHRVPKNSPDWHFSLRLGGRDRTATVQWVKDHWCGNGRNNGHIPQVEDPDPKQQLIQQPNSRPLNQGAPFQAPPLPDHFVERPEQQRIVKGQLLNEGSRVGTLVVSAIYGLGGIGKSVLASKLAFDGEVQSRFCDGILWATLGQKPDILPLLSGWIQALGDHDYKPTAIEAASNHLRTLLYGKRVLLVVDDIWHPPHLEAFRVGGEGCCVLVTTREARIPEAHRYDLDVMTAAQALELMTQKLAGKLTEANRDKALAFADRVGYLPLALELAAAQIEEGVLWSELLEDLQDEVARLETLDIYGHEEIPDDAKRRKYSLLACFNLSLKQLAPEQLQQFAWLGVVPEDVSLTQEMAETLWQVTSRQARAILRTFRAKALVLQGAQLAEDKPSYRMHDLMHDLAQRLLVSPTKPKCEWELPGLGLTKTEAHGLLLERYREKTDNGEWHTLTDDGYIFAHLTWHMEQAEQPEEIHRLLRVSNDEERNGWYEACDAIGKPAGFVNDLGRAWQLSVESYETSPGGSVALLYRYALIRGSLNNLASNVPAEMVGGLVKHGFWQAAQGLAYAQQAQDPWHRAACISAIVPDMPEALLPEVLKTIGQINDAAYRSYVLSKLAEKFSRVWPDMLEAIQQIQDRYGDHRNQTQGFSYKGLALSRIVVQLPKYYFSEVIDITHKITAPADRVMVWIELAKLQVTPWSYVLKTTRKINDENSRSWTLREMLEHLPKELWPEALEITRQINDEKSRAGVLRTMAEHLPELWSEALEITRQINDEKSRAEALSAIAKHLPELWLEVLEITRKINSEYSRSEVLRAMAKHLPKELWSEALEITRQINDDFFRSWVLRAMAEHLPRELWPRALEITRQINDENSRSGVLRTMAEHLPELWPEALELTRQINDENSRSGMLSIMAEHLPELWLEALEVIQQIKNEFFQSGALRAIAEHLPKELWPEALEMTRQMNDEKSWAGGLHEMVKYLPKELWPEALEMTRQINDENFRAEMLRTIAEHLPKELWPTALEITRQINDENSRSRVLRTMAEHLPKELWSEALEMTRQINDENSRFWALCAMAEHLPELWPTALEITQQINDENSRSWALCTMAKHLPELWSEALEMTRQINDENSRSRVLRTMAEHLPKELWSEALEMTRKMNDENSRAEVLRTMAEHLPKELWPKALEMTQQINNENSRSVVLSAMAEYLLKELWSEALKMIRQINNEKSRSVVLRTMAEYLSKELWSEALEMIRQINDENSRSVVLSAMAEYLPKELWPEALEMTRQIQVEDSRSRALIAMTKHLPEKLWSEALDIVWAIKDKYYCSSALQAFLPNLEKLSISFTEWVNVLNILAYQNRSQLFHALPESKPTIMRLGNEQAFSDILQAVRDVCQQWP